MDSSRTSTMAVAAVFVLVAISAIAEGSKGPDISIVKAPNCEGKSKNNGYNKNVARLVDLLLQETKNVYRGENSDYKYTGSYPTSDGRGSATGGATCDKDLGKSECLGCLVAARRKLGVSCDEPIKASVKLHDCSLWFDKACALSSAEYCSYS